nr:uncharacterized protein LOC128699791 isoform X1 [Cherax quadricarinatus]
MVYGLMVTGNRCLLMLAWCWVQALLTALPPLLGWARYKSHGAEAQCSIAWSGSPSYTAVWVISVFLIPVIIMLICYYYILQVARNKCRQIHVGKVLGSISSPITPEPSSVCLDDTCLPRVSKPPLENGSSIPLQGRLNLLLESRLSVPLQNGSGLSLEHKSSHPLINGTGHLQIPNSGVSEGLGALTSQDIPCRSRSVTLMNRISEAGTASFAPKRKLADFGRSLSFCQPQTVRPCLRRAQSSISMRPSTARKKLSLGGRKPSWSWEASPAKGFRTVCVVVGTHVFTWAPYSALAIAEAILGQEYSSHIPHWVTVTSTLLLFTASIFYPIVYGLYNRSIRKEIVAYVCPISSRDRRRGSCHRRTSTLHSNTGSVLDFSSLRSRENEEQQQQEALTCPNPGLLTVPIRTISGTLANSTVPSLSPLLILAEYDDLSKQNYVISVRKPSQDSGAVMGSSDDPDSDMETPACLPQHIHSTRRVSAPSILDTVCENPHTIKVPLDAINNMSSATHKRKSPIIPFASQMLNAGAKISSLRRSHSLEMMTSCDNIVEKETTLKNKITYSSLHKKHSLSPVVRETHFNTPSACERIQRRKSSVSVVKVVAIPEDIGTLECADSGSSVDSGGDGVKTCANRQVSIDEGIGVDCLIEEESI